MDSVHKVAEGRKFYLFLVLILLVGLVLRTVYLSADPPQKLTKSQDASTDPFAYTYFAKNLVEVGESNPYGDPRWVVYEKSTQTLVAYLIYSIAGTGRAQGNFVGVILNLAAILFLALGIKNFGSRLGALIFALFACLNFTLTMFARIPFLEASQNVWLCLAFFFFSKGHQKTGWYIAAGAACAASAFFGKMVALYAGGVFFLIWVLLYMGNQSERKVLIRSFVGFYAAYALIGIVWLFFTYMPSAAEVSHYYAEQGRGLYGTPRAFQELSYFLWQAQNLLWDRHFIDKLPLVTWLASITGALVIFRLVARGVAGTARSRRELATTLILVWLVLGYGVLFPFNYRPLRYQTTLMFPILALCGFAIASVFEKSGGRGKRTRTSAGRIVLVAIIISVWMLPVIGSTYLALVGRDGARIVFAGIYTYTIMFFVVGAVIGLAIVMLNQSGFRLRRVLQLGALVFTAVFVVFNLYSFVSWVGAREYTLITADRDLGEILSPDAVISGSYGSALTQENGLGCVHHQFGVEVPDKDFFAKYPITHIAVDKGNESRAVQDYPELMSGASVVSTYVLRGLSVKLYRIAEVSPNAQARQYKLSEFERAMAFSDRGAGDSALVALVHYSSSNPRSYSAELMLAQAYARGDQFDQSFSHFRNLMDISKLDGLAAYSYGFTLLDAANKLRQPVLKDSALHYLEIAAPRMPLQQELQSTVERLSSELR